jgi:hypothetical protein
MQAPPATIALKPFQVRDLAAASLKSGLILAWEQGLGKTTAAFLWPQLRRARRSLLVAPASLHDQLIIQAATHFSLPVRRIDSIEDARRAGLHRPLPPEGTPTTHYLVSWEALTRNKSYERLPAEQIHIGPAEDNPHIGTWAEGVGETRNGIFCTYTPSLSTQLAAWTAQGRGVDCVVADEGTRLQADDSLFSTALRRLVPANRLILTGTPIKNRLDSIFWPAWWVAGGSATPTALWPYEGTPAGRSRFAEQHLQIDRFHTREKDLIANDQKPRRIEKRSNRVCNIEHLYKLLAPLILRRRKTHTDTYMQPCTYHPVNVKPGTHQWTAYERLLALRKFTTKSGKAITDARTIVARRLELLRECCLAPWSPNLPHRSPHLFTPKTQAILATVEQALSKGEQVLIASPYHSFTTALMPLLKEAGIRAVRCDGTEPPASRALLAAGFKRHQYSVMVAGLKAMAEGHDFAQCSHLIVPALSWAMDEVEQFIHRIWRLTSPRPLHVWLVAVEGTLDSLLAQAHQEKKASAGLALDGELSTELHDPVSLEQLLAQTLRLHANLPSETALTENEAHLNLTVRAPLLQRLRIAQTRFDEFHPPAIPTNPPTTAKDQADAVAALNVPMDPLSYFRRCQKNPNQPPPPAP